MSDIAKGEGWWQASDLKWYPPEQHPDFSPPVEEEPAPLLTEPAPPVAEPAPLLAEPAPLLTEPAPLLAEPAPPVAEPAPGPPQVPTPPHATGRSKWVVLGIALAAGVAIAAFLLANRGGDGEKAASVSTSQSSQRTTTTAPPTTVQPLTEADVQAKMLTVAELGTGLKAGDFARNEEPTLPCGTPNPDSATPPTLDVGIAARADAGILVQEEIVTYPSSAAAQRAFDDTIAGYDCAQGTLSNSSGAQTITFTKHDRSKELGVDQAIEFEFDANGFHGRFFVVRTPTAIVAFSFSVLDTVDSSTLPDPLTVVKKGLQKAAL